VGVIILAAGESRRFGKPKQLAEFRGQSLIRRAVAAALESVCKPVVVVLGANAEVIEPQISGPVKIVYNSNWESGMGSSIRAGVTAIESEVDAVILMLCDQPLITSSVLNRFAVRAKAGLVAAEYGETAGVPALFAREFFEELKSLDGAEGAKSILIKNAARVERIRGLEAADIDTVEDLMKFVGESVKGG
jgi:molybdenum cofactor cytidylyltransferase